MQPLRDLEIGVMFWAGGDLLETVREIKGLGVRCGQIGIPGDMELTGAAEGWRAAIEAEQPLGRGSVGMERFLDKLKSIGYTGTLNIEREGAPDHQHRLADIRAGVELLESLR